MEDELKQLKIAKCDAEIALCKKEMELIDLRSENTLLKLKVKMLEEFPPTRYLPYPMFYPRIWPF